MISYYCNLRLYIWHKALERQWKFGCFLSVKMRRILTWKGMIYLNTWLLINCYIYFSWWYFVRGYFCLSVYCMLLRVALFKWGNYIYAGNKSIILLWARLDWERTWLVKVPQGAPVTKAGFKPGFPLFGVPN